MRNEKVKVSVGAGRAFTVFCLLLIFESEREQKIKAVRTTADLIRMILAVWSTITEQRHRDALVTVLAEKLTRFTALHCHFPTTRGRCCHTAGGHQLICKSRRRETV